MRKANLHGRNLSGAPRVRISAISEFPDMRLVHINTSCKRLLVCLPHDLIATAQCTQEDSTLIHQGLFVRCRPGWSSRPRPAGLVASFCKWKRKRCDISEGEKVKVKEQSEHERRGKSKTRKESPCIITFLL
jgi:hypothetical protein